MLKWVTIMQQNSAADLFILFFSTRQDGQSFQCTKATMRHKHIENKKYKCKLWQFKLKTHLCIEKYESLLVCGMRFSGLHSSHHYSNTQLL